MDKLTERNRRTLEIMMIIIVLGMTALFTRMRDHRLLSLNLFYLPVILSGYFLGRFSAGILALFSALTVTIASLIFPHPFASYGSPVLIGLALTIWSAILGLAAILIGTLCDERATTVSDLQRAYVGIAEVLSKYLHGSDPKNNTRAARVAQLSQTIAEELRLPAKIIDDVRVAALLHDLGSVEITTQVISRVVDSLETGGDQKSRRTFMGTDLIHSLGEVLHGALPLLVNQDEGVYNFLAEQKDPHEIPTGVHVIRAARLFDQMSFDAAGKRVSSPEEVIRRMRMEGEAAFLHVIDTLERIVTDPPAARSVVRPSIVHPRTEFPTASRS